MVYPDDNKNDLPRACTKPLAALTPPLPIRSIVFGKMVPRSPLNPPAARHDLRKKPIHSAVSLVERYCDRAKRTHASDPKEPMVKDLQNVARTKIRTT